MMTQLELIYALDPRVCERARRLSLAIELLRNGTRPDEARRTLRERFGLQQPHAWRIVDMANDMAGPLK